jgi:hypothetical protein
MRKSLLKRYTTSQVSCVLLLIAVTTLTGCQSCDRRVAEVQGELSLQTSGKCPYPFTAGQQSIFVDVKGTSTNNTGNHWTGNLSSQPSNKYPVTVPSQGSYKITVTATETAGTTQCISCTQLCGANPNPVWRGEGDFTGTAAAVPVAVPDEPSKADCGC